MSDRPVEFQKMGPGAGDVHVDQAGRAGKPMKPRGESLEIGKCGIEKCGCVTKSKDPADCDLAKARALLELAGLVVKAADPTDDGAFVILKASASERMVYGWASVISKGGVAVRDTQGDVIEPDELVKATTDFMLDVRHGAEMHKRNERNEFVPEEHSIGAVVHSFPLTAELMKGLGISSDREGWIVGMKVRDDRVWKRVEKGELRAFSIGGAGVRVPYAGETVQ
jgi:hypothetical protein